MPAKGTKKCEGCGGFFNPDHDDVYFGASKMYCWECHEAQEQYAHTAMFYSPCDEPRTVRFDEEFVYFDSADVDWEPYPAPVKVVRYVRTDAWRGHYVPEFEEDWSTVASGWTTGWTEDAVNKVQFNDLMGGLNSGEYIVPVELVVVLCHTSNVFSVGVNVAVRSEEYDTLMAWLESLGCDLEEAL